LDWRKVAEDDLKHYREQRMGLQHLNEQIKEINTRIERIAAQTKNEKEKTIDLYIRRDKLILARNAVEPLIRRMDESLSLLSSDERRIVERLLIDREKGAVERLCSELFLERTRVYEMRNSALRKFTVAMYGVESL
jgi:hypothetical protein